MGHTDIDWNDAQRLPFQLRNGARWSGVRSYVLNCSRVGRKRAGRKI